jgi:ribosomal protein L37E
MKIREIKKCGLNGYNHKEEVNGCKRCGKINFNLEGVQSINNDETLKAITITKETTKQPNNLEIVLCDDCLKLLKDLLK